MYVLICLFVVSLQDIPQYDSGVDALQRLIDSSFIKLVLS